MRVPRRMVGILLQKEKDECMDMSYISEHDFCKDTCFVQAAIIAENAQCCGKSTVAGNAICVGEKVRCEATTVGNSKPVCSGVCLDGNEVTGTWSKDEVSKSSTWRRLRQ